MEDRVKRCGTNNFLLCVSHYLDPYSHGILLKQFGVFDQTKEQMKEVWNIIPEQNNNRNDVQIIDAEDDDTDIDPVEKLLKLDDQQQNPRQPVNDVLSPLELEMRIYENKPRIEKNGDRLSWWKQQEDLKLLKVIAQEVLSIPISSAKSERVFSTSGRVSFS